MADGTVVYLSFIDAIERGLPKKYQFAAMKAIVTYGATGEEPDLTKFPAAMGPLWMLIKPQLDANNRRRQNGAKGGRPKKKEEEKLKKPMVTDIETIVKPKKKVKDYLLLSVKDNNAVDRPDEAAGLPAEPPSADEIQELKNKLRAKGAIG